MEQRYDRHSSFHAVPPLAHPMRHRSRRAVAMLLCVSLALLTSRGAQARPQGQALCRARVHTMVAAQSVRAAEEMERCLRRGGGSLCRPWETPPDALGFRHISADEHRLARGLARVERHARDKFPRKCVGDYVSSYFAPICARARAGVFEAKFGLTECVYVDHSLSWLQEMFDEMEASPASHVCKLRVLHQARLGYRDLIRDDKSATFDKRWNRATRKCDAAGIALYEELIDIATAAAVPLRFFDR